LKRLEMELEKLICRFVVDGKGKKIGESIALDGDILIIKRGKEFIGVPLKHIDDEGEYLKVKGLVSMDKARKLGRRWEERYEKKR